MILLIAPASPKKVYQGLSDLAAKEPPIWCALLQKALLQRGEDAILIDQEANELSHEQILEDVLNLKPKLISIVVYGHQPSASTQTMHAASELVEVLAESRIPICLIGGHPSSLPIETLQKEKCQYLAKGEGLNPLLALAANKQITEIPGLYFKRYEEIFVPNSQDKKADNLDLVYPGIEWSKLPMHKYRAHMWHVLDNPESINSYAAIYTSLGCPFKCSFCCINAPFDSNSFRYWSPRFTVSQIELLYHKYGIQNLKIADEMFVLKEDHFMNICRLLIEKDIKMNIWAYARVDTVKPKYLETLKKAGVNWLALGIESGSQFVRDGVTKGRFKIDDILQTRKIIQEAGINVIGNYIFGLPDDTVESMKETYDMAVELNCEFANFYSAMAYPGSPLYNQTKREDLPDSYIGYSQHSYESKPLRTRSCTAATVIGFRDEAHSKYFANSKYLSMVGQKFGKKGLELISKMDQKGPPSRRLLGDHQPS